MYLPDSISNIVYEFFVANNGNECSILFTDADFLCLWKIWDKNFKYDTNKEKISILRYELLETWKSLKSVYSMLMHLACVFMNFSVTRIIKNRFFKFSLDKKVVDTG